MDPGTRKLAGWVVAAVGAVITVVALLADQIGIGSDDEEFGGRQVAMLVVGLVILAVGLFVALALKGGETSEETAGTQAKSDATTPTEASKSDSTAKADEPEESGQADEASDGEEEQEATSEAEAEAEADEEASAEDADKSDEQADEDSTTKS